MSRLECVSEALRLALAVDSTERTQAEALLEREQHSVGFAPLLLRLACCLDFTGDPTVHCNAAVLFKNLVRARWPSAAVGCAALASEDCAQITANLLPTLLLSSAAAQRTLVEAASVVVIGELKQGSTTFLLQLVGMLQTANAQQLECGLLVLHLLCRQWRSFNYWDHVETATAALPVISDAIQPLFIQLIQSVQQRSFHNACMHTLLKILRSLVSVPEPPLLSEGRGFVTALTGLLAVPDEKVGTRAAKVLLQIVSQHIKSVQGLIGPVLEATLARLVVCQSAPNNTNMPVLCLDILASSCEQLRTWTDLAPAILSSQETLIALRDTVVHFASWNQQDSELISSDPTEFAMIECDGREIGAFDAACGGRVSTDNKRHAAYRLAQGLGQAAWPLIASAISTLLQESTEVSQATGLLLASAIHVTDEHAEDSQRVTEFALRVLLADTLPSTPVVIGALATISTHCLSMAPQPIHSVLDRMASLIQQPRPIPDFTFRCVEQLCEKLNVLAMSLGLSEGLVMSLQQLEVSIMSIIQAEDDTGAAAAALVVLSLLRHSGPSASAPIVLPMMEGLRHAFARLCVRPAAPMFVQSVFETFLVLIELHAPGDTSVLSAGEALVAPMIQMMVSDTCTVGDDMVGIANYVYRAMSQLIKYRRAPLPAVYTILQPCLLHLSAWSNSSSVNVLVQLCGAYLAQQSAEMGQHTHALLHVVQALVASTSTDHEGLRLLGYLFTYLDRSSLLPLLQSINSMLVSTLEQRSTTKYERALMITFSQIIVTFGLSAWTASMQGIGGAVTLPQLVQRLFLRHAAKVTSAFEGRVCAVAMIAVLCGCHGLSTDLKANLVQGIVCMVETLGGSSYEVQEIGTLGGNEVFNTNEICTELGEVDMVANVGNLEYHVRKSLQEYAQRNPESIRAMAASIGASQFDVMYRHWFN